MSSKKLLSTAVVAAAVTAGGVAGALLGAPVMSGAQDAGTPTTTAPAAPGTSEAPGGHDKGAPADRTQGGHVGENGTKEELLTGDTAAKVTAAALAANPGATVDRVENDAEGSPYEAHITKADGTHATVKVDANFTVTATEDDKGGHGGGRGGRGGPGGGHDHTPVTGADADKAGAAALAANPGATVVSVEKDPDGTYDVRITKADGTKAMVELDANFTVTETKDAGTKPAR